MIPSPPTRTPARPTRSAVVAVLALVTTVGLVVAVSPVDLIHDGPGARSLPGTADSSPPRVSTVPAAHGVRKQGSQPTSSADEGATGAGVSVFDDRSAAVANLDPALLSALRGAAKDAGDDEVELVVNSGWRSAAYQRQLLEEAVVEYGSKREAERWVAAPETSAHVSGDAADLGPSAATSWLSHHGAAYGLCQVYRNEPWHYELRPGAVDHGCPAMYADATQDPRMQQ